MNINWKKICLTMLLVGAAMESFAFETGQSGYVINVGGAKSEYTLMSFFVLPNQSLSIEVVKAGKHIPFKVGSGTHLNKFDWTAPANPGLQTLLIQPEGELPSTLHMFILHPMNLVKNNKLNGYTIGEYPKDVYKGLDSYRPPLGFVEVTKSNQDMLISPHYTLRQFLCKQNEGYPKYVVLQTRLLRKLEYLTTAVNAKGIAMDSFTVMSGYRTPYYNTAIKNKKYSRHQWGGAADIYVDVNPKDGVMDDLNRDGKVNEKDAKYLWDMVESFCRGVPEYKPFIGGLGLYKANAVHGPFVHVDVRGTRARW
ncbi:MAG: hypothetical protein GY938_06185 [Ketobacter sp.]|nr:hypothetical protein [Ketobacter sp.]